MRMGKKRNKVLARINVIGDDRERERDNDVEKYIYRERQRDWYRLRPRFDIDRKSGI